MSNWIIQIDVRTDSSSEDLSPDEVEDIEGALHAVMSGQLNPWDYTITTFEE